MSPSSPTECQLRLRFVRGDEIALGPGKVDLLDAVNDCGSISRAAAAMGMSYRRAWLLINTMNQCFSQPLVVTRRGGDEKGGSTLSPLGKEVLRRYRDLERSMLATGKAEIDAIVDTIEGGEQD